MKPCNVHIRLLLFTLLSLSTGCLRADLLSKGAELQKTGQLKALVKLFRDAAGAGDVLGAYGLGVIYYQGTGVPKDLVRATHWFRTAAEQGYVPAQYNLGNAYLRGEGVARDLGQAARWWRRAADRGYARAEYNLGSLLLDSGGAQPDLKEEGIAWMRAAAVRGFPKAKEHLRSLGEPLELTGAAVDPAREPARGEAWLLTLDPGAYVVQVFSGRRLKSALGLLRELHGAARDFRFLHGGEQWFGVVFGVFRDRAQAQRGLAELPAGIRRSHPWIRSVAEVQRLILASRAARHVTTPGVAPAAAGN